VTKSYAVVYGVYVADNPSSFVTREEPNIKVELGGIPGDRHYGLLRPADSRQKIYPRGTPLANRRQISIVSLEDCEQIARAMNIFEIIPEWLGANIAVREYEQLSQIPIGTRLIFPDGTGLICEGENLPCIGPGREIENVYNILGLKNQFVTAAKKLRGIVCSVEREGIIHKGDTVKIYSR
jgi:hypothetical protein